MSAQAHQLERDWRIPRVAAFETDALQVRDTVHHLEDLAAMFEYEQDTDAATEVRGLIGLLRSKANDRESAARQLEATLKDSGQ